MALCQANLHISMFRMALCQANLHISMCHPERPTVLRPTVLRPTLLRPTVLRPTVLRPPAQADFYGPDGTLPGILLLLLLCSGWHFARQICTFTKPGNQARQPGRRKSLQGRIWTDPPPNTNLLVVLTAHAANPSPCRVQVRSGQVRSGQARSGQVRPGRVRFRSGQARVRSGMWFRLRRSIGPTQPVHGL